MDIISLARELGKAIQADSMYLRLEKAKRNNDEDQQLQDLIGEFNLKRIEIQQEVQKADRNQEKLNELDKNVKELYQTIMSNENMTEFNEAKKDIDELLNFVNKIIVGSVNGQDPDSIEEESSCGGSCSSCSGCH